MDGFLNSVLFSIVNGISCEAYFGTIAEKRVWKQKWVGGMTVLAFGAGFMIISYTPVPPYIFQPVRLAVVVAVAAQLYFRIKPLHNLLFSILFCSIYWMETMLAASLIFMLPQAQAGAMEKKTESIVAGVHLCLMLAFHYRYKKSADHINANHTAVNVVLNQKYQEAGDRGIAMAIAVNDLSGLTVSEEEIVTLLVNLIDNAMEACGKLDKNKIIQFKMMLEEGELILSVRNPVKEPVRIKDGRVATSKEDAGNHGIGLLNVEAVIKKNAGTSVIRCEDGWFSFSAMIPIPA